MDTVAVIDRSKKLSLSDLGLKLPPTPPTQVVSIRLPTSLLNKLRAKASACDVSYQALIKLILSRSLRPSSETLGISEQYLPEGLCFD